MTGRETTNLTQLALSTCVQALVILAAVAAAVAAALPLTRPLWDAPTPAPPAAPSAWVPFRVPGSGLMLWRPANWTVRCSRNSAATQVVFQASQTAFVGVHIEPAGRGGAHQREVVERLLAPFRQRPGFNVQASAELTVGGVRTSGQVASWWEMAGLRPVVWHCELHAATLGQWAVVGWFSCAAPNWTAFAPAARQLLCSLRTLRDEGR